MNKKIYISGPISGRPRDIYMAQFERAAELLKSYGYDPVNPTKFWVCRWRWLYRMLGYELTLLYDVWRLLQCHQIYKIPGWRESRGCNIESCFAFHFQIFPIGTKLRDTIDKKMAKFIEKQTTNV